MKWGSFKGKNQGKSDSLEDSEYLTHLLITLCEKRDTPALIAYLANDRTRLLLCKALISPVSSSDLQMAERALRILKFRGMNPEELKKRLEPAAFALGLVSGCDIQIDYYEVLGVEPSATAPELRAAYRKKAFELHPDTARQSTEGASDFLTVKAAYDSLRDPGSRAAFDQCRIALDSWREEDTEGISVGKGKRRPSGKLRKAFLRVAAVVGTMVVIAWVLNILYQKDSMLELARLTPLPEPKPAMEMAETDPGEAENKDSLLPETGEATAAPKPKTLKTAAVPAAKPAEVKRAPPPPEPVKKQTQGIQKPQQKRPEKAKNVPQLGHKKPKESSKPTRGKAVEKPEPHVSETVQAQPRRAVSKAPFPPPNASIHTALDAPLQVRGGTVPKTPEIPFIKRSQVLAFLKRYTAAYEGGKAEAFFSNFTSNATENGAPLKSFEPDYREIWDKTESLDYRISVNQIDQVVGSDTVFMKGRFDLDWKFINGRSGKSRGEISMDLKLNRGDLMISRLNYRFYE